MEKWVRKAQNGDKDAFVRLMEENQLAMYRTAKAILHNESDVEDAVQEAVCRAFYKICTIKQPKYFKTWLTRILINNCNRLLREARRVQPMDELPEPAGVWDSTESNLEFKELIESLPENDRMIFVLHYGEGFTTKEISRTLDIRENTVKSRLRRGRERLRNELLQTI